MQREWLPELVSTLSDAWAAAPKEVRNKVSADLYKAYELCFEFALRRGELGLLSNPDPYTARGVLRTMWNWEHGQFRGTRLIHRWRELEDFGEGLGSVVSPLPYTLRWLFQQLWREPDRLNEDMMLRWAQMEAEARNVGDKDAPAEFSARWVFRQAWKEENRARLCNAELMLRWAQMEAEAQNVGDKDALAEYSARWVFRQAWKQENRARLCNSNTINEWAQMEAEARNVGDKDAPAECSARWVFRQAWEHDAAGFLCNRNAIWRWVSLEIRENNFGVGETNNKYTARWIAVRCNPEDRARFLLACIAAEEGNLGEFDSPLPGTARYLFRELYQQGFTENLRVWARYEYVAGGAVNNGGKNFDATWIFEEWKKVSGTPLGAKSVEEWLRSLGGASDTAEDLYEVAAGAD